MDNKLKFGFSKELEGVFTLADQKQQLENDLDQVKTENKIEEDRLQKAFNYFKIMAKKHEEIIQNSIEDKKNELILEINNFCENIKVTNDDLARLLKQETKKEWKVKAIKRKYISDELVFEAALIAADEYEPGFNKDEEFVIVPEVRNNKIVNNGFVMSSDSIESNDSLQEIYDGDCALEDEVIIYYEASDEKNAINHISGKYEIMKNTNWVKTYLLRQVGIGQYGKQDFWNILDKVIKKILNRLKKKVKKEKNNE